MESDHFGRADQSPESASGAQKSSFEQMELANNLDEARLRALGILYYFHALRFPNNPLYSEVIHIVDKREFLGEADAYYPPPEQFLTDPSVEVGVKVAFIGRHFRSLGRALNRAAGNELPGETPYERVIRACDRAYEASNLGEDLTDASGEPLSVQAVLPEAPVINEMWNSFVVLNRSGCRTLNTFVRRVFETNA